MINAQWISLEDTHIYMIKFNNIGELSEWHPVGQVILRQIHINTTPRWYAYSIGMQSDNYFIGHFESKETAIKAVENRDY